MANPGALQVELISRGGCHLCDEALAGLEALGLRVLVRDVDQDAELFRLYDFRVPVVLREGTVLGEGRIDPKAVAAALTR